MNRKERKNLNGLRWQLLWWLAELISTHWLNSICRSRKCTAMRRGYELPIKHTAVGTQARSECSYTKEEGNAPLEKVRCFKRKVRIPFGTDASFCREFFSEDFKEMLLTLKNQEKVSIIWNKSSGNVLLRRGFVP